MSPSSTVHGGQYDTKYVTFECLLQHVALMGDIIWGDKLEPARARENNCFKAHQRNKLSQGVQ